MWVATVLPSFLGFEIKECVPGDGTCGGQRGPGSDPAPPIPSPRPPSPHLSLCTGSSPVSCCLSFTLLSFETPCPLPACVPDCFSAHVKVLTLEISFVHSGVYRAVTLCAQRPRFGSLWGGHLGSHSLSSDSGVRCANSNNPIQRRTKVCSQVLPTLLQRDHTGQLTGAGIMGDHLRSLTQQRATNLQLPQCL